MKTFLWRFIEWKLGSCSLGVLEFLVSVEVGHASDGPEIIVLVVNVRKGLREITGGAMHVFSGGRCSRGFDNSQCQVQNSIPGRMRDVLA